MPVNEPGWTVLFYTEASGREPVAAFLSGLDARTQIRFEWAIEQLRLRNLQAREPLVRHLEGPIWELRRTSDGSIYRLLYVLLPGKRILFLHGFQKKTQQTPRREIVTALDRLASFQQREGGHEP